jgi:hypothetical protein
VYGIAFAPLSFDEELAKLGFAGADLTFSQKHEFEG